MTRRIEFVFALVAALGCRVDEGADGGDDGDTTGSDIWNDVHEHGTLEVTLPEGSSSIAYVTACCAFTNIDAPELCEDPVHGGPSAWDDETARLDLTLDVDSISPTSTVEIAARITQPGLVTWTRTTGGLTSPGDDALALPLEFVNVAAYPCDTPATVELFRIDDGASEVRLTMAASTTGLHTAVVERVELSD